MAFTVNAPGGRPYSIGNYKQVSGTVTVDNTYVNGTGFTVPATVFGLSIVKHITIGMDTTLAFLAVHSAGGANATFKVLVLATLAELANGASTGLIFPFTVVGD